MRIGAATDTPWTLLELEGALDLDASPGVYLRFQRELLRGNTHVLFDLAGVDVVDSHGLGVLVRCFKDARRRGGDVALQSVPDPIGRILEFTRLDSIFQMTVAGEPPELGPDSEAA